MNKIKLNNQDHNIVSKASRKVKSAILELSVDERLDLFADIIIERIFEESKNGKFPLLPNNHLKKLNYERTV